LTGVSQHKHNLMPALLQKLRVPNLNLYCRQIRSVTPKPGTLDKGGTRFGVVYLCNGSH
jgi:hypothetical protein